MKILQRNAALAMLLLPFSAAFTPVSPPAVTVAAPESSQVAPKVATSSSSLPTQKELLQKSSTVNVAAASSNPTTSTSVLIISDINYNGKVPTTESDEYVVITNGSKNPIDISGYYIYVATTGTQGPTFTFPKDSIIKPGQSLRIYTNEIHKETGGYSFGSGKAIWNNRGGLAVLKDFKGTKLGEFKYKGDA
jgi:Lamin Tail Domain